RLGRPGRMHRRAPRSRARARAGHHRRLQRAEHAGAVAAGARRAGARVLVPVVLQYRARPRGPGEEPSRDLPQSLAGLVADVEVRRRVLRAHGAVLRQPRLRAGGHPLLPSPHRHRAGRPPPRRGRATPGGAPADHGAHADPARRRRRGEPAPQWHGARALSRRDGRAGRARLRSLHAAREAAGRGGRAAESPPVAMRIEVICTGDEVLSGKIVNTNFAHISQKLEDVGLSVAWETTVGDDRESLLRAFQLAGERADAVIVNGGLGQSHVDALLAGVEALVPDGSVKLGFRAHYPQLETKLTARGRDMDDVRKKLAPVEQEIRKRLGNFILAEDDQTLEGVVLAELTRRQATLAIVEMFTSGQVAARFAHLPGAEKVFRRGVLSRDLGEVCAAVGLDAPAGE